MAKILVTYPIPESGITLLQNAGHEVVVRDDSSLISRAELEAAVTEYEAILPLLTDTFDAALLDKAGEQLQVIANYAVGYDNIDVAAATAKGITVTNTPDVLTDAVAEHAVTLLAALARRVVEADRFTRAGNYTGWKPQLLLGTSLSGKTLGIVGLGRIGFEVAKRARQGFTMKIAYTDLAQNDSFEQEFGAQFYPSIDELLPQADAISLHVPLVEATHHLLNAERLAAMKPTALVVNTARGPVIDEAALADALQKRQIAGAALDVFEEEPAVHPDLLQLENVILTPHIASATTEARGSMAELAAKNIIAVLADRDPLTPVRPR